MPGDNTSARHPFIFQRHGMPENYYSITGDDRPTLFITLHAITDKFKNKEHLPVNIGVAREFRVQGAVYHRLTVTDTLRGSDTRHRGSAPGRFKHRHTDPLRRFHSYVHNPFFKQTCSEHGAP